MDQLWRVGVVAKAMGSDKKKIKFYPCLPGSNAISIKIQLLFYSFESFSHQH